jgi:predicted DNA-binding transcriptional regulator YafY
MPKNKQAYIRYRIIDSCLRKRKGYYPSKKELIEACKDLGTVSARTIDNDIYAMKYDEELGYGAPIEYSVQHNGYFYTDPNYSITKIPLKQEDLYAMEFACSILKQFEGIDAVKQFMESVNKIEDFISMQRTWGGNDWNRIIQTERSLSMKGNEFLSPLLLHIKEQRVLMLHYQRYGETNPTVHEFHPYVLKEYRNRWYCTGYSVSRKKVLTFALERIREVITTKKHFEPDASFDADAYFKHSFGISVVNDYEPQHVVLKCASGEAPFIKSLPLHQSQVVVAQDETGLTISLDVIPSYELRAEILRYGDKVEVLAPAELRNEIIAIHKKAIERYSAS